MRIDAIELSPIPHALGGEERRPLICDRIAWKLRNECRDTRPLDFALVLVSPFPGARRIEVIAASQSEYG